MRAGQGIGGNHVVTSENLLLSIGQSVEWGGLLDGENVERRPNGSVIADPVTLQTAVPDIFLGGEGLFNTVVPGPGEVVLQSMPINKLALSIQRHMISTK